MRHAEQPALRGPNLLARGTAEEETEECLLQRIVGRLPVVRQRAGVTKYAAGLLLVKVCDFLLDSRFDAAGRRDTDPSYPMLLSAIALDIDGR